LSLAAARSLIGHLQTFIAVAEARSFRAAGESIGRSQPAVTAQIGQLEAQLGVKLFLRDARRVALTLAGRELLPRARRLVAEAETLVRDFQGKEGLSGGRLALSVAPTVASGLVARALHPFRLEFPAVQTSIREDMADAMFGALAEGAVEVGVGPYADPPHPFAFTPILEQPFLLTAPRGHPFAGKRPLRFEDIAGQPLILPSRGTTARRLLAETAERRGIALDGVCEATQYQTIAAMAAAGLGVAVMPLVDRRLLDALDLVATPFDDVDLARAVGVIAHRDQPLSPPARAFCGLLELLAASPDQLGTIGLRPFARPIDPKS